MQDLDFSNKVVFVSGGGAGIGRAIAEAFGIRGGKVVIAELDQQRCADTEQAFSEEGIDALVAHTDVRDREAVDELMQQVQQRFGGVDVLVNNVGDFLGVVKPFADCDDDEIDALYATNLKSMFIVTRAAIPLLRQRGSGGSIINISSIEAFRAIPMATVYSSFKHAITGFTRSLAVELGPEGIRVNAIAPETTETAQVQPSVLIAEEHRDHVKRWIPMERFGTPSDAVNLDGGALAAGGWYRDPNNLWTNVPVVTGNGFNF